MSKITKQHEKAEELLWGSDRQLNYDEVAFCLEHWDPRAASGKHVAQNQARACKARLYSDGISS
jgi:hypothetical protein